MFRFISKIGTKVDINPKGSHVVILCLVGILLFCLASTFFFIYHEMNYWPPLIFSLVLLAIIVLLWFLSHRDIDGRSIPPVNISMTDGVRSTTLSLHHRSITEGDSRAALLQVLSQALYRSQLPEPDGLVDHEGQPNPEAVEEAKRRVDAANSQSDQILNTIFAEPTSLHNQETIQQDSSLQAPKPSADNETASSEDES